ncbi:hypothetical protein AMTRI_Chr08g160930 [Amborella trichopoda]
MEETHCCYHINHFEGCEAPTKVFEEFPPLHKIVSSKHFHLEFQKCFKSFILIKNGSKGSRAYSKSNNMRRKSKGYLHFFWHLYYSSFDEGSADIIYCDFFVTLANTSTLHNYFLVVIFIFIYFLMLK